MRITFTGDILIYESQDNGCRDKIGKYNYYQVFEKVKPIFDQSDYVIGSLETTFAGEEAGYTHASYSFNTPDELLPALNWAGFDMLTTANNHCLDRGIAGLRRTIQKIQENSLEYTGTRATPNEPNYLVKDINGTKIAFVAYTYGTNSKSNGCILTSEEAYMVNLTRPQDMKIQRTLWKRVVRTVLSMISNANKHVSTGIVEDCVSATEVSNGRNVGYEKRMLDTIREAKRKSDIVIMCLHSGGQFNSKVGVYTQHLFDIIADAGADAIICNHAHTTLPIYQRDGCIIASALGNFSFAPGEGYWVDGVDAEYSTVLHLDITEKRIISYSVDILKCKKNEYGVAITVPLEDNAQIEMIRKKLFLYHNA